MAECDSLKDSWAEICDKIKKERAQRATDGEDLEPAPGLEQQELEPTKE